MRLAQEHSLHIIPPSGQITVVPHHLVDLRDGVPTFEFMREQLGLPPNATLERIPISFQGRRNWMWVDEDGRRKKLPRNPRASELANVIEVVGPAAIWEGDWS